LQVREFYLTFLSDANVDPAMNTLTITSKGQVTLRKDLLKHLRVQAGEKIIVHKLPDGRVELKAAPPVGKISDVFNIFKRRNSPSL